MNTPQADHHLQPGPSLTKEEYWDAVEDATKSLLTKRKHALTQAQCYYFQRQVAHRYPFKRGEVQALRFQIQLLKEVERYVDFFEPDDLLTLPDPYQEGLGSRTASLSEESYHLALDRAGARLLTKLPFLSNKERDGFKRKMSKTIPFRKGSLHPWEFELALFQAIQDFKEQFRARVVILRGQERLDKAMDAYLERYPGGPLFGIYMCGAKASEG